jgi:glucose 1-dehydrogenase
MPLAAPYAASKGGMEMLTKTLALEVADKGIRINSIAPGAIATMMNLDILEDEEKRKAEENKIPMHRIGEPNEIGKVALFLASGRSKLRHWYNNLCGWTTDTSNLIHFL